MQTRHLSAKYSRHPQHHLLLSFKLQTPYVQDFAHAPLICSEEQFARIAEFYLELRLSSKGYWDSVQCIVRQGEGSSGHRSFWTVYDYLQLCISCIPILCL